MVTIAIENYEFDPVAEFPKVFNGLGTMPGELTIRLKKYLEVKCLLSTKPIVIGL